MLEIVIQYWQQIVTVAGTIGAVIIFYEHILKIRELRVQWRKHKEKELRNPSRIYRPDTKEVQKYSSRRTNDMFMEAISETDIAINVMILLALVTLLLSLGSANHPAQWRGLSFLPLVSLALAFATVVFCFLRKLHVGPPSRVTIFLVLFAILAVDIGLIWTVHHHGSQVQVVSEEIVELLQNEPRTFDELWAGISFASGSVLNEAVNGLVANRRIEMRFIVVNDQQGRSFKFRVFSIRRQGRTNS
jgi:hypothetical protein